jgi:hypothetical protein
MLHVVWDETKSASSKNVPSVLLLKNLLDAPLAELNLWLENESASAFPENLRGQCCAPLRELDETQLTELLRQAARVRFQAKAAQFCARARHVGWEQTLWENLFRALGYKHNAWPMQNLAETKSRWTRGANSAFEFQARLLGVSGLLPDELTRAQKISDTFLRRVWDFWWRDRDELETCVLPRAVWKFHGLRPATIRNGGSRSRRTGWRRKISFQKSKTGARRKFPTENFWIRCMKFSKLSATNSGRGIGRSNRRVCKSRNRFWAPRAGRIWP